MKRERPKIERVERQSAVLVTQQVAKLKETFPESVTEGKVDFEKGRQTRRYPAPQNSSRATLIRACTVITQRQTIASKG